MQQKQTYLNESIDDLKLVRVVKDIENYQKIGDSLIINKNPNAGDSIRNTTHFTLNGVVSDHAYGSFSDSKYAIIADLQDTAKANKVHGVSAADTWFWNENGSIKLNKPTLVMPENDKNIEKFAADFHIVQYQPSDITEENFSNLKDAVKKHFEEEKLNFYQIGMWGWANGGHGMVQESDQRIISEALGSPEILPSAHSGSNDEKMEQLNAEIVTNGAILNEIKTRDEFLNIKPLSVNDFMSEIADLKENKMYAHDYYLKSIGQKLDVFNQAYKEKQSYFENQFNQRIDALETYFDKANLPFPDGSLEDILSKHHLSFDDDNKLSSNLPPIPPALDHAQVENLSQSLRFGMHGDQIITQNLHTEDLTELDTTKLNAFFKQSDASLIARNVVGEIDPALANDHDNQVLLSSIYSFQQQTSPYLQEDFSISDDTSNLELYNACSSAYRALTTYRDTGLSSSNSNDEYSKFIASTENNCFNEAKSIFVNTLNAFKTSNCPDDVKNITSEFIRKIEVNNTNADRFDKIKPNHDISANRNDMP